MTDHFVITAVGSKRPGIVAAVSELICACDCNLEDSRMTLLGEHFALLTLLSGSGPGLHEALTAACRRLERDATDLTLVVFRPASPPTLPEPAGLVPNYEIRVAGSQRRDLVSRSSRLLADHGINILDLATRVTAGGTGRTPPRFTLWARVRVPNAVDGPALRGTLADLAAELQVEISLTRTTATR